MSSSTITAKLCLIRKLRIPEKFTVFSKKYQLTDKGEIQCLANFKQTLAVFIKGKRWLLLLTIVNLFKLINLMISTIQDLTAPGIRILKVLHTYLPIFPYQKQICHFVMENTTIDFKIVAIFKLHAFLYSRVRNKRTPLNKHSPWNIW